MNDIQRVLALVSKRIQWMREEGETDLRSIRDYVGFLSRDAATKSVDEIEAEAAADEEEMSDD